MNDHYDFRGAERGKFYRPLEQLRIPSISILKSAKTSEA